jgi:hypothetical protein
MKFSALALAIYEVLRKRVPAKKPELAYTQLIEHLPPQYSNLEPDGEMLAGALGELVTGCRAKDLPAISAMVVRFRERVPGPGYYPMAHPDEADDDAKKMIAWGIELEKVRATTYPATL